MVAITYKPKVSHKYMLLSWICSRPSAQQKGGSLCSPLRYASNSILFKASQSNSLLHSNTFFHILARIRREVLLFPAFCVELAIAQPKFESLSFHLNSMVSLNCFVLIFVLLFCFCLFLFGLFCFLALFARFMCHLFN